MDAMFFLDLKPYSREGEGVWLAVEDMQKLHNWLADILALCARLKAVQSGDAAQEAARHVVGHSAMVPALVEFMGYHQRAGWFGHSTEYPGLFFFTPINSQGENDDIGRWYGPGAIYRVTVFNSLAELLAQHPLKVCDAEADIETEEDEWVIDEPEEEWF